MHFLKRAISSLMKPFLKHKAELELDDEIRFHLEKQIELNIAAGMPAEEAMIHAGRRRLRPIVMTAMAAVAGMLPLSLAIGAGSQMLQPLAIAVIGGILISMILSLVITPAMEFFMTRKSELVVEA